MKTTVVLNKYRLVYSSVLYPKVQYSTSAGCCTPSAYILYLVCSYMESNSVLVAVVILLLLCRQQGEEFDQNAHGMRNRRQNVYYAFLEVCIL